LGRVVSLGYDELANLMKSKPAGPRPFFSEVHLIRCLELVKARYYGRKELVRKLGLGEGSVRTIVGVLRSAGFIEVHRAGAKLTEDGRRILASLRESFSEGVAVPAGRSVVDVYNVAILVRGAGDRANTGIEQRDAAMMAGSSGASTFVYSSGKLIFPGMYEDLSEYDSKLADAIIRKLNPEEGDAVVVGSAGDPDLARIGGIAAALTLI
jgi:hypothetical protein